MILKKLVKFLDEKKIKYMTITHSPALTAQEIAATAHIPGRELAKTVIVKAKGNMKMAVLPASDMIDFTALKEALGVDEVVLATEAEFKDRFPECEVGAMPPFGNLFGMEVIVANTLTEDNEIAFNAGTHRELLKMTYKDYETLVTPRILRFTVRKKSTLEL